MFSILTTLILAQSITSSLVSSPNPAIIATASGNAIFYGNVSGGSGAYNLDWAVNGIFSNGTVTSCIWNQLNANVVGNGILVLTRGGTLGPDSR